jgi:hypothetical protein
VIVIRSARTGNVLTSWTRPTPAATAPAPPAATAPPSGAAAAPAKPTAPPIAARAELDGLMILTASEDGSVQRTLPRGTTVRNGDVVVRYRQRATAKQRELERLNAKLDDNEDNPELVKRARELAAELAEDPPIVMLKSALDGVIVGAAPVGSRLRAGEEAFRVARALRLTVDPSIVTGSGNTCQVQFVDQKVDAEGRRVGNAVEITRFPAQLSLDSIGAIRVSCK